MMKSYKDKKPFLWADIIRTTAIYLILLVHSSSPPSRISLENLPHVTSFVFAGTGVPLFVMLSGALLLGKTEKYSTFFHKRLIRILIPWAFWTSVTVLLTLNVMTSFSFQGLASIWYRTFISFWFLPMIVGLYLLTPVMRVFVQSARTVDLVFLLVLWFLSLSVIPYYRETLAFPIFVHGLVPQIFYFGGFFLTGYLITRFNMTTRSICITAVLFSLGLFCTAYLVYVTSMNTARFDDHFYKPVSPGIVVTTISLFILLYKFGTSRQNKLNSLTKKSLARISSAAFGIYLMHQLVMPALNKIIVRGELDPLLGSFVYSIVLFGTSALIIVLLQQVPRLKRVVS